MEKSNRVAVYPGSFDPITKGHVDIINRTSEIFDRVVIAVLKNMTKKPWFDFEERVQLIKKVIGQNEKIEVKCFDGLLVDFMEQNNAGVIIRGLRAVSDYEYELQLSLTNSMLSNNKIETIFLPASRENLYLSSSIVKEISLYGAKIEELVDESIVEDIKRRAKEMKEVK